MRVLEILLSKDQRDKDISPNQKKEMGLLKKKIDQYMDALSKPSTSQTQRASLHKKMTAAVAEVKKLSESKLMEAVYKLPLIEEDFDKIKDLMEHPIPAALSLIYLQEVIVDDELNDMLKSLEESEPNRDIRPLIVEWMKRVMPDQMYRFGQDTPSKEQKEGRFSPIHGYDPHEYHGQSMESSGNAYGRK